MFPRLFLLIPILLTITSCENAKEALGFKKRSPDEFSVSPYPTLAVPPEFDLKPPAANQAVIPSTNTSEKARDLITGSETAVIGVDAAAVPSQADSTFLQKIDTDKKLDDIRAVVDMEAKARKEKEDTLLAKYWPFNKDSKKKPGEELKTEYVPENVDEEEKPENDVKEKSFWKKLWPFGKDGKATEEETVKSEAKPSLEPLPEEPKAPEAKSSAPPAELPR